MPPYLPTLVYTMVHHPGYTIPPPSMVPDTRHAGTGTGLPR